MGGRDWFQASVSAVGIPAVAGSDSGRDSLGPYSCGFSNLHMCSFRTHEISLLLGIRLLM